jgi:hypothetical protein
VVLRRLSAVVVLIGTTVVLAGCYGSTEPATNVELDHATLHGYGTADQGTTHVWFQYWPTAQPGMVTTVTTQDFGDETGPVSRDTRTLTVATNYSFRLCGSDQTIPQGVCAQTRAFRTLTPAGDFVRGGFLTQFTGVGHDGTVDAHSDAGGTHPGGTVTLPVVNTSTGPFKFSGTVTCVRVQGSQAAVGAVGIVGSTHESVLLALVDKSPSPGLDQVGWTETPGSTPPDCATAVFQPRPEVAYSDLAVYDHP